MGCTGDPNAETTVAHSFMNNLMLAFEWDIKNSL